jgi:hypothetical protein
MKKLSIFAILSVVILFPVMSVFAQTNVDTATKVSTTTQKVTTSVRDAAMPWYQKIDAWRVSQNETWKAIKSEKELQITQGQQQLDDNRDNRVDRVLNEEQASLVNGAGDDIGKTGNVFLLKLYVALLTIFVIIFSYPLVFYTIIVFLIVSIISSLVNKIRNPHAF